MRTVTEMSNNLANIIEVAMWHSFLTDRLAQFIQQNVQLIFRWQIVQAAIAEWFPRTKQQHTLMCTKGNAAWEYGDGAVCTYIHYSTTTTET